MIRLKVTSPTILSVGYEPDSEILQLEFPGSKIYEYHKVDPVVYMGLMDTDLKSVFFSTYIKDKYDYKVIEKGTSISY